MKIEERVNAFLAKHFGGYLPDWLQAKLPEIRQDLIDLCGDVLIDTAKVSTQCAMEIAQEFWEHTSLLGPKKQVGQSS